MINDYIIVTYLYVNSMRLKVVSQTLLLINCAMNECRFCSVIKNYIHLSCYFLLYRIPTSLSRKQQYKIMFFFPTYAAVLLFINTFIHISVHYCYECFFFFYITSVIKNSIPGHRPNMYNARYSKVKCQPSIPAETL